MIRRVFLVGLVLVCLLALNLGVVPLRAQYDYQDKVLALDPDNLIAYWPLTETSGTTAYELSGNGFNGTYNGVSLAQVAGAGSTMGSAPLFDGVNDYVETYSSGFAAALGNLGTVTISLWGKVVSSGVWTDNATRWLFEAGASGSNRVLIGKDPDSQGNDLRFEFAGNGTARQKYIDTTTTDWFHAAIVVSSGSPLIAYFNGASNAGTGNTVDWSTSATTSAIGRSAVFSTAYWPGYIGHVAVWSVALSGEQIAELADPAGLPTPTPTATLPTNTPTVTLEFGTHIILSSGQVGALYYKIDSGAVLLALLLLLQIGLLLALLALRMWRRG